MLRRWIVLAGFAAVLCAGLPESAAATPLVPGPALAEADASAWRGRFCTPAGCRGAPARPWSTAASFGAAILAAGWMAHRQQVPRS